MSDDFGGFSGQSLSSPERAIDRLLADSHLLGGHQLPSAFARYGDLLGVRNPVVYLIDLQQNELIALPAAGGPAMNETVLPLRVDSTLAGRAFQQLDVFTQTAVGSMLTVWLPLLDGAERLGVLAVTVDDQAQLEVNDGALLDRLKMFATIAAELVMTKTMYGDTLVRLRRRSAMGLAAEMQWSLLPPLTFACHEVTIAAALEPAYEVAGDTVDYAVDEGVAHVAVFDGMGHGLLSAQLAALTVAAYRNARRAGEGLVDVARSIDRTILEAFGGDAFATGIIAELDTATGRLRWISAGHPPPLLLRDGRLVKTLEVTPAPPLGLGHVVTAEDVPTEFTIGLEDLEPDDRVLLYTDGVVEARSPSGEFFGVERLVELLTRHLAGNLPAPETMRRVVHALLAHQQDQLSDDATLLLLDWRSEPERNLVP
jgi:serine phosphatase RsbU (regulator of sigma subunit)